jgi:radial spoke head protein 4A
MALDTEAFLKLQDGDVMVEHLTNVLLKIVKEKPEDALQAFESHSLATKKRVTDEAKAVDNTAVIAASQQVLDLIKPPKAGGDDEEEEEEEEKEQAPIPDIMAEATLLNWAGYGLDEEELYTWFLSIQNLATDNELQNVKFWGVIKGTEKDYFIVEAKLEEYEEGEEGEESKNEPMGTGANEAIYYVANDPTTGWTKLPPVQSMHIILARQMRRFFTGNLDAVVLGFPRFPWKEAAYLRAQIARIAAGSFACPKDVFTVDPEDEEETVTENEEYNGITPMLLDSSSFVHSVTHLLKEGRTTPWVNPDAEDEDEDEEDEGDEEKKKDEPEKEVPPPKLRAVGLDEGEGWKFAVYPSAANPSSVIAATCFRWPGSVTVAQEKTYVNWYYGYGLKNETNYSPPNPPPMAEEYPSFDPSTAEEGATDLLVEQEDEQPPEGWTPPEEGEYEEDLGEDLPEEGAEDDE